VGIHLRVVHLKVFLSAVFQKHRCASDTVDSYWGLARFDFYLVTVCRNPKFWWYFWVSPIPVVTLRRGSASARLLRVWVRIPPVVWMSICCECCVTLRRADRSSRGVLSSVVCLSVTVNPQEWGGPGPLATIETWGKKFLRLCRHMTERNLKTERNGGW
jgi:hypothetical protein